MDQGKARDRFSKTQLVVEKLVLVLLNEDSGYLDTINFWNLQCAIAGAVVGELALLRKIDIDLNNLGLLDSTPTGDEILDPFLAEIEDGSNGKSPHTLRFWIEKFALKVNPYLDIIFDRLVQKNFLLVSEGGFYSTVKNDAPQNFDGAPVSHAEQSRNRIKEIVKGDAIPNPQEILLITLLDVCGSMQFLFEPEELAHIQKRVIFPGDLELLAQSLNVAVAKSYASLTSERTNFQEQQIPKMSLRELFRKSMQEKNMALFFNEIYEKYGPVVEIWFPKIRQRTVLLIGADTNTWLNRNGRIFFRSKDYIKDFEAAFGASQSITSMDGSEHYRLRKLLGHGYSRSALENFVPEVIAEAKHQIKGWKIGKKYSLTNALNLLLSAQSSRVMLATDIAKWQEDFFDYERRCLQTTVQRSLPRFMLRTPKMKQKWKYSVEMVNAIRSNNYSAKQQGQTQTLANQILNIHRVDPQLLPDSDLLFALTTPIMASTNMSALFSIVVWYMLANAHVLNLIRGEAAKIFADDREPIARDFEVESIPNTNRLILECLRLYPTIPGQIRHVYEECNIGGFQLPIGLRTFWAIAAPHYSTEHYTEPNEFDIARFAPPREEHKKPGVFNPWGLGTHTCMGTGWVELQLAINALLLAHYLELELTKSSQKLSINPFPKTALHSKVSFTVSARREQI